MMACSICCWLLQTRSDFVYRTLCAIIVSKTEAVVARVRETFGARAAEVSVPSQGKGASVGLGLKYLKSAKQARVERNNSAYSHKAATSGEVDDGDQRLFTPFSMEPQDERW